MNSQRDVFIFMGPPGAGKGSLSALCVKELGWAQLSTGNLCRQHIDCATEIGKQIDFTIKSGKLIPDSLIIDMVDQWLAQKIKTTETIIFDGFPRTVHQAQILDAMLRKDVFSAFRLRIVTLQVADDIVIRRLLGRVICAEKTCQAVYSLEDSVTDLRCQVCSMPLVRRSDDEELAIRTRLALYHKYSQELGAYYQATQGSMYTLSVERPIREVFMQFLGIIGKKA